MFTPLRVWYIKQAREEKMESFNKVPEAPADSEYKNEKQLKDKKKK